MTEEPTIVHTAVAQRADPKLRRILAVLMVLTLLCLAVAGTSFWYALDQKNKAAEAGRRLAETILADDCAPGDGGICKEAQDVVDQVPAPKDGSPGRPGRDGADGADGQDGRDGAAGRAGKPGANGTPGEPGADGQTGPGGPPGPAGVDGAPGKDGANGADGKDGAPGTAQPGTYLCPEGQVQRGFTITPEGAVVLECAPGFPGAPPAE